MSKTITKIQAITTILVGVIALLLILFVLTGCTSYFSLGRQMGADEIIIRKYESKVDLSPELLLLLQGFLAGEEEADEFMDEPLAAASNFNSYELSKWSKAVRARDGYICYMCNREFLGSGELEAHHIMPKSKYPETAYCMWNGITLCDPCHLIPHKSKLNHKRYAPMFLAYTLTFEGPLP